MADEFVTIAACEAAKNGCSKSHGAMWDAWRELQKSQHEENLRRMDRIEEALTMIFAKYDKLIWLALGGAGMSAGSLLYLIVSKSLGVSGK